MYETDLVIDANATTIRVLEPIANEIAELKSSSDTAQWQYRLVRHNLSEVNLPPSVLLIDVGEPTLINAVD